MTSFPPSDIECGPRASPPIHFNPVQALSAVLYQAESPRDHVTPRIKHSLKALQSEIYDLGREICGFGEYAEAQLSHSTGVGVENRIIAARNTLRTLLSCLHELRVDYVRNQLRTLGITAQTRGLQLHIGGGPCNLRNWVNI